MSLLFNDLPILNQTKEALIALGFETPTPIQELAIPKMIEGIDLIGQAQTGTGKTFAYGIPMIEKTDTSLRKTQGLILCPTRELTIQVYKEIIKLVKFYPSLKVTTIVGGESYDKQFRELAKNPHIIVATPGRMIDHINRNTVDLSDLKILTLDEADEMLKMGFQEDLESILKAVPVERQTVLFSATMPSFIRKIANNYQKNPELIKIESKTLTVDKITQGYFLVKDEDKTSLLKRILDLENPKSAMIFANTKADVDRITAALQEDKYLADALHGDLKQSQRNYVMTRFRNKQLKLLIATDVAARGLDVSDVELIVNYDLPNEDEVYVHRIGRTGRAGKKGKAYSFVTPRKRRMIEILEKFTKAPIPFMEIPDEDAIYEHRIKDFKHDLKLALKHTEDTESVTDLSFIKDLVSTEEAKDKLISILLKDLIPVKKSYPVIEPIQIKKRRDEGLSRGKESSSSKGFTRGNGKYVDLSINLGKKDGMTPQNLFKFLEKEFGIYSKNIGDIKHHANETVFGLNVSTMNRIKTKKTIVHQGKKITIKELSQSTSRR